ncbi:hypothetical protein ACFWZW_14265 [Microbacterium enclense]|uniref:hypothetical protein n=1 Tax=Microbacterium enclense TaxID=993073 RepID=UPI0036D7DE4A
MEPHVLGALLTRGELESIADELGLDGVEVSDAALTRRVLEHPEGEKLVVAADLSIPRALRMLFQRLARENGFLDAGSDWIAFNAEEAYVEAVLKPGMDPIIVVSIDAFLLSTEDARPSRADVSAWIADQPSPVLGSLAVGSRPRDGGTEEFLPVLSLDVVVDAVLGEFVAELIAPFVGAWDSRSVAIVTDDLEFGPGGEPYRVRSPADTQPKNAWLLVGTEASFPNSDALDESRMLADAGLNNLMWTAPKNGDVGDLVLFYFLRPRKAVHFVARLASRPFWRSDVAVAADKPVDVHQYWAYVTPLLEVEPISYSVLREAHGGHLPLRGRSGHYLSPEVVSALRFTAVYPNQQSEVDHVATVPVRGDDLPNPESTTFHQWRSIASGQLSLEAKVSEHIVRPLGHLVYGPEWEWTSGDREPRVEPSVGPVLIREQRVASGFVDFVFNYPASTPALAIEVKLAILRPQSGVWGDSPDFRQLRRYMDDLGTPGLLIDAQRILLVRAGEDEPFAEVIRAEATWDDLALIHDLMLSQMAARQSRSLVLPVRPRRVARRG